MEAESCFVWLLSLFVVTNTAMFAADHIRASNVLPLDQLSVGRFWTLTLLGFGKKLYLIPLFFHFQTEFIVFLLMHTHASMIVKPNCVCVIFSVLLDKVFAPEIVGRTKAVLALVPVMALVILFVYFRAKTQLISESDDVYQAAEAGMVSQLIRNFFLFCCCFQMWSQLDKMPSSHPSIHSFIHSLSSNTHLCSTQSILTIGALLQIFDGLNLRFESQIFGNISRIVGSFLTIIGFLMMIWALMFVRSHNYPITYLYASFTAVAFFGFGALTINYILEWVGQ
jgi:hypothetical protein